ncbi:adenylate kinase [Candidatus Poribacteria bacterium]|nr:adenylate kinase [Candidatus Poribacteria bacterium]
MRLVIFGPPGVGKGTQATRVATRYGLAHISTGDTLRQTIRSGSPLGLELRSYLDKGLLAPDLLVADIIERRLIQPDCRPGFILDGFPRTLAQAYTLDSLLKKRRLLLDATFFLDAEDDVIIERISGRRTCPHCGRSFHVTFAPPRVDGVCDADGEELVQRPDDEPVAVRKRLEVYNEETAPLREYFDRQGLLVSVDGTQSADAVESAIVQYLTEHVTERP